MRIKRTFAPTMRDALQLVKQEQGPDAVILGNKKVPGGVEILSAIDFDEAAISSMAAIAPAPRRELQALATPTAAIGHVAASDVASDAWVGSILDGGRKEPTLGPVAAQRSPVQVAAAVTEAILPAVAASPGKARQPDAEVRAAVARSRAKPKAVAAAARKKQQALATAAKATAAKAAVVKAAAVKKANARKMLMTPDIVLNPPQAAILGVGRVRSTPVVDSDRIEVGQVMTLSLTFDHRITDGAPAARFLDRVAQLLARPYMLT